MTRPLAPHSQDILEEALSLTNGDRAQDYGDMQASFERIAASSARVFRLHLSHPEWPRPTFSKWQPGQDFSKAASQAAKARWAKSENASPLATPPLTPQDDAKR